MSFLIMIGAFVFGVGLILLIANVLSDRGNHRHDDEDREWNEFCERMRRILENRKDKP